MVAPVPMPWMSFVIRSATEGLARSAMEVTSL
jgi:hypothetical protein